MVLRNIAGLVPFDATQLYAADVDGNGEINVGDAILILRYIVRLIPGFPHGSNNRFANSYIISGESGQTTGFNEGATKETGEPDHGYNPGGKSVWWSWTAPRNGNFSFNTHGSNFDTTLGVYTGAAVDDLIEIANNDDADGYLTSRVTFTATAGTSYYIAVDGYGGASGEIILSWEYITIGNDDFANSYIIIGESGQTRGSNEGATKETGEPDHGYNSGGKSVWWSWTAPFNGIVSFNTHDSNFDTTLGVYTGAAVGDLTEIANNNDADGYLTSRVIFTATAGTTYHIAVDGYGGSSGEIVLSWVCISLLTLKWR